MSMKSFIRSFDENTTGGDAILGCAVNNIELRSPD